MDDEGTVVYFKTSPSVQESPVLEEEDVFGDAETSSQTQHAQPKTKTETETVATLVLNVCLGAWNPGQSKVMKRLISELKNSPLLTEEDSHILHISLTHNTSLSSKPPYVTNSWMSYLMSLLVALVAISLYTETHLLTFTSLVILILSSVLTVRRTYQQRRMIQLWQSYSLKCEEMLSLLTKTLRLVQETEVLSRGYSRPSVTVPVSRMELNEDTSLQCIHLRGRLFNVCLTAVLALRGLTKKLCVSHSTLDELDSHNSYLAFRDLGSLHQHMQEDTVDSEEYTNEKLSLESLKDACNLLAVQNSEFLRRLTLVLGLSKGSNKLSLFESSVGHVLQFVKRAHSDLGWSFQYHKEFLFGDPPTRSGTKAIEQKYHTDLQPLVDEINCLDLKLQLTLQSVRDIGVMLVEKYSGEKAPSDQELMELCDQLSSVESRLAQTSEHVSEGMAVLDKLKEPSTLASTKPQDEVPLSKDVDTQQEDTEQTEELSEEEDLVFEAYIPLESSEDECEVEQLAEEERQRLEEAKEVPEHLLRELTSVLAVRNEVREKRKQEKRTKKSKQVTSSIHLQDIIDNAVKDDTSTSNSTAKVAATACDHKDSEHKRGAIDYTPMEDTKGPANEAHTKQNAMSNTALDTSETKGHTLKTELEDLTNRTPFSRGGLEQRSLAQAVAAVALKQRQRTEEFFEHSED